jgi:hypothetical protein
MPQRANIPIEVLHKRSNYNAATGCIEWIGSKDRDGYGTFSLHRKPVKAHRMAFALYVGEIPKGLSVLHSCHNRGCINPEHLRLGTTQDNTKDMVEAGRQNRGEKVYLAKMRAKDIIEIRTLYKGNYGDLSNIGRKYGITPSTVQKIVKKQAWRHIV